MTTEALLDAILVPRPNGSAALERVASFLQQALEARGAGVELHAFTATPHGFQLVWGALLLAMCAWAAALLGRRYGLALAIGLAVPLVLFAEFELLLSPLSGLLPLTEHNVVGRYPGSGGPTLIFSAHYDTATHFGDHFAWERWGWRLAPALGVALGASAAGLALRRRGRALPRAVALAAAGVALVPFSVMAWFQGAGPLLREPSPGAVDNGGSVAALLRLADRLAERPPNAPCEVRLVFLAAEEERALGSWRYAEELPRDGRTVVVNLESIGASDELAFAPEDGFDFRRFRSPAPLVALVNEVAAAALGRPLREQAFPHGVLSDGRSFLAHGIPTLTLQSYVEGGFPPDLHSAGDARTRLSLPALEATVDLLAALVARFDAEPGLAHRVAGE